MPSTAFLADSPIESLVLVIVSAVFVSKSAADLSTGSHTCPVTVASCPAMVVAVVSNVPVISETCAC